MQGRGLPGFLAPTAGSKTIVAKHPPPPPNKNVRRMTSITTSYKKKENSNKKQKNAADFLSRICLPTTDTKI